MTVSSEQPAVSRKRRGRKHLRNIVGALTLCGMLFALCSPVQAQQGNKASRIGFLAFNDPLASKEFIQAFRQGLGQLGYTEGENVIIEYRWAKGKPDYLPKLAAELVALKVDVIFAAASPSIKAAKNATDKIPIVFETLADPSAPDSLTA
jgi:putative tryptophan/tyrosine transport system substrate-binding protein